MLECAIVPEFGAGSVLVKGLCVGRVTEHHSWFVPPSPKEQRGILNVISFFFFSSFSSSPWEKKSIGAGLQLEARACALLSCCQLERCPRAEHRSAHSQPRSLQVRRARQELALHSAACK